MNGYNEICNQIDLDTLINLMVSFHDSMVKEIHIINRGAVLSDKSMLMSHKFDARVLIQSQIASYPVELLFIDALVMNISDPGEFFGATGSIGQQSPHNETRIIEMKFDNDFHIISRQLFYRFQPEFLGMKTRFNSEIPSPKAIPARIIDEKWRQCTSCCEAWEENPNEVYSVCPNCHVLTELIS